MPLTEFILLTTGAVICTMIAFKNLADLIDNNIKE